MLTQLTINNFAIVRELEIDFRNGMTAITGETGAGKSIAIDALGLCLGNREVWYALVHCVLIFVPFFQLMLRWLLIGLLSTNLITKMSAYYVGLSL